MNLPVHIRPGTESDAPAIREVVLRAFDRSERDEVAGLVSDLLADPTAQPVESLVAETEDGRLVGHVLFTSVQLIGAGHPVRAAILAPLAVHPNYQGRGIGGRLVMSGLDRLREAGVELVFVLGHPGYYPRFGFRPAGMFGLQAPYPIPAENAEAWMVCHLKGDPAALKGRVKCADALNRPELWQE